MLKKVQVVSLHRIPDVAFRTEELEMLGFTVKIIDNDMHVYWGKPEKPKKKDEEEDKKKPERRSKTERRLGSREHG